MVLGYEWLVGATTVPALHLSRSFSQVDEIRIGALVDEEDVGGPAVAADFEHLNHFLPAALTRRAGAYIWREGNDAGQHSRHLTAPKSTLQAFVN